MLLHFNVQGRILFKEIKKKKRSHTGTQPRCVPIIIWITASFSMLSFRWCAVRLRIIVSAGEIIDIMVLKLAKFYRLNHFLFLFHSVQILSKLCSLFQRMCRYGKRRDNSLPPFLNRINFIKSLHF